MKKLLLILLFVTPFINYAQIGINQPTDYEVCDEFGQGFGIFDFSTKDAEILGALDPSNFVISYHESFEDAEFNVNPLVNPYTNISNPQIICARVEEFSTGNFEIVCFGLVIHPTPIPFGIQDVYEICNGSTLIVESGLPAQEFTFSWSYNGIILPNETSPFLPVFDIGVYSVEVINLITGCTSFTDFEVIDASFDFVTSPSPYIVCDNNDDGIASFNLDTKTPEILGANQNPSLLVTYHLTQADADAFTNVLDPIFTNTVPFFQTLFARVSANTSDCYTVTPLELEVDINCVSASSVEAFVCAQNPNDTVDFDLTSEEANMLNGQNPADFTISYYYTESDAQQEVNEIVNPDNFPVDGNTIVIHVRIENQSGDFTIVQLFLNFDLGPNIFLEDTYTICNNDFVILTPSVVGSNGYTFLWNTGATDPEILVTTEGTYSVQVTDLATGCVSEASTMVLTGDTPIISTPADIIECVPNAAFNLTSVIPEVLNGQSPNDFVISFFTNINDALSDVQPIINPESYVSPFQGETIYVRVENSDNDCFEIVEFDIFNESSCPVVFSCDEGPINTTFCYDNNYDIVYTFESLEGIPLQITINAGQVENVFDELIILDSDGVTNLNSNAPYGNSGDISGLTFTSTGSSISLTVDADGSISCINNNYTPIDFDVSCVDPNALPDCDVALIEPENGAVDVNENTNLSWNAASGVVLGYKLSIGLTSGGTEVVDNLDVGSVLTYDPDTFEYETTYYVSIVPYNANGDAENCSEESFTIRANPNQIINCDDGALNTTYCYDNDDTTEFSFQSSDGLPLTLIFNSGSTEVNFDEIYIVDSDGTILNPDLPYGNAGDFTGLTYTSSGGSISVRFDTDFTISCADGSSCCTDEFDFDVFCASTVGFIQVNAFVDNNANSIFDTDEPNFSNGYFTYEVNGDGMINTVNSSTGSFQIISANETDVYEITFNLYDESEACYDVSTSVFSNISVATGNTVTVDFPVVEEQSCEDLAVYLINNWAPPRPGFVHDNYLYLENLGFTTIASGTVEFTLDPQLVLDSIFSVDPAYTVNTTATGFTVDFVNLQPGDSSVIGISILCPVDVELGEIVTNTATYLTDTNDLVASNNYSNLSELVVGSWDPNDKMESHGPRVLYDEFSTSDEWLYYTIRFQNLGTADAIFVRIEDTLDDQLDETTFEMLRSSHEYVVTRTGSDLEWFFDDIFLPAEQDDAEGSIGFVYFRIKPMPGYGIGDIIPNTAAIYFDFNAPVITNRFDTEFIEESLSVAEFDRSGFNMYPNPVSDILNISLVQITDAEIEIIDIQGKRVISEMIDDRDLIDLDVSELQGGIYFVRLTSEGKTFVKKLVKE